MDLPQDPPMTAALLARLLQRRRGTDRLVLAAVDSGQVLGYVKLGLYLGADLDRAHGSLWVFPGERRRGVGRLLVGAAREHLTGIGRDILLIDAPDTAAADAFTASLGGRKTVTNVRNRLLLTTWSPPGASPMPGVRLTTWTDHCPDDLVADYAHAWSQMDAVVNGQARSSGATVAHVRTTEEQTRASGHRQYAVAAVDGDNGRILGCSTMFVRESPMTDSGETLVLSPHRRRGLGAALKGHLLGWTRRENPHVTLVQAWNEAGNKAILRLNRRLGFEADQRWSTYRFKV